jgi:hypothetical protein
MKTVHSQTSVQTLQDGVQPNLTIWYRIFLMPQEEEFTNLSLEWKYINEKKFDINVLGTIKKLM